ncbi:MAG: hypothetical protein ACE5JO_02055 [Candidatus Binatia bacterium]
MRNLLVLLIISGLSFMVVGKTSAQGNIGRFQLVSISVGQKASVFLIDTASGCTWQLASKPATKRPAFVEMDIENLHWSWGSGAQQKLTQKIDQSELPEQQKQLLKIQLNKTACGWTPVVLTPGPPGQ